MVTTRRACVVWLEVVMKTSPVHAVGTGRGTAGPARASATIAVPPGSWPSGRRRRPTGEPPPLPRHLESTGVGWLVAAVVLVAVSLLVFADGRYGQWISLTAVESWVLAQLAGWGSPGLTGAMEAVAGLGSLGTVKAVSLATLLMLVACRRFRHLLVGWASRRWSPCWSLVCRSWSAGRGHSGCPSGATGPAGRCRRGRSPT
jgi:hypothetical protein